MDSLSADPRDVSVDRRAAGAGVSLDRLRYRAQHYGLTASLAIPGRAVCSARNWIHGGIEDRRIGLAWSD